jgi:hypothetical protein
MNNNVKYRGLKEAEMFVAWLIFDNVFVALQTALVSSQCLPC